MLTNGPVVSSDLSEAEFLQVATHVTGLPASVILNLPKIGQALHALSVPSLGFGNRDYYPTVHEKAARMAYELNNAHAFPDGNKRIAWMCTYIWCRTQGWVILAEEDEIVANVTAMADDAISLAEFGEWIASSLIPIT